MFTREQTLKPDDILEVIASRCNIIGIWDNVAVAC